ncbi:MAG: hypothetical protein ACKVIH_00770 [Burkholderiales bacterium]
MSKLLRLYPGLATQCMQPAALHAAGAASALLWCVLAWRSHAPGGPSLLAFYALAAGCMALAYAVFRAWSAGAKFSLVAVLCWAALFRLIGVLGMPLFEDDFYRYLWDGRMTVETGSPYLSPPAAHFSDDSIGARFQSILNGINHPFVATVYGPVCQWVFAAAYWLAPGSVWPLQVFFTLADGVIVLLLARLAPARWVLLYAWCPLVIKEFAFTAHTESLAIALALGAVCCGLRGRYGLAALVLALAVGAKVFALALLPFVLGLRWRAWGIFTLALLLVYWPFGWAAVWPPGLQVMAEFGLFNASGHLLLHSLPSPYGRWLALAFFALLLVLLWHRHCNAPGLMPRGDLVFAALLFVSPVVNAWYWCWVLPFAVIYPSRWAFTASAAVLLSYATARTLGFEAPSPHTQPLWAWLVQYALIAGAALADWRFGRLAEPAKTPV